MITDPGPLQLPEWAKTPLTIPDLKFACYWQQKALEAHERLWANVLFPLIGSDMDWRFNR